MAATAFRDNAQASAPKPIEALSHGELVKFSGKTYEILRLENPYFKNFLESPLLTEKEKQAYGRVIEALVPVCGLTDRIAAKQYSENALEIAGWLGKILGHVPATNENRKLLKEIATYRAILNKKLTLFNDGEATKYFPSFTASDLKEAINSIPSARRRASLLIPFKSHTKAIFSSEPMPPGGNVYRFRGEKDKRQFLKSLGPEYRALNSELKQEARKYSAFPDSGLKKVTEISQKMNKMQAGALKEQLNNSGNPLVSANNTIVYISYNSKGKIKAETKTFEEEFAPELAEISECFKEASRHAKEVSPKLSKQLGLISKAVVTGDYSKCDSASYRMASKDSFIDVAFEYQETYFDGVFGKKGEYAFNLRLLDPAPAPEITGIRGDPRFRSLNIERWMTFLLGGHSKMQATAGQSSPTPTSRRFTRSSRFPTLQSSGAEAGSRWFPTSSR